MHSLQTKMLKLTRKPKKIQTMSLHIKEISPKQINQAKLISTYEDRIENTSNNNKTITKFDTARRENEEYFKMKFDEYKAEIYSSIDMKMLTIN